MRVHVKSVVKDFKLASDPEGEASVSIRQARTGDTIRRAQLFQRTRRVPLSEESVVALEQNWNYYEQMQMEVMLTLTNATGFLNEDDEEIFRFKASKNGQKLDMSQSEFAVAWGLLPDDVAEEIHQYVLEINPQWGWSVEDAGE